LVAHPLRLRLVIEDALDMVPVEEQAPGEDELAQDDLLPDRGQDGVLTASELAGEVGAAALRAGHPAGDVARVAEHALLLSVRPVLVLQYGPGLRVVERVEAVLALLEHFEEVRV